jgi:hypothetical protein
MKVRYQKIFDVQDNEKDLEGKIFDLVGLGGTYAVIKDLDGTIWAVDQTSVVSVGEEE